MAICYMILTLLQALFLSLRFKRYTNNYNSVALNNTYLTLVKASVEYTIFVSTKHTTQQHTQQSTVNSEQLSFWTENHEVCLSCTQ